MLHKVTFLLFVLLSSIFYFSCSKEIPNGPGTDKASSLEKAIPNSTIMAVTFQPLPYENATTGRNSYAYNPAIGHPTADEKTSFVNTIKPLAQSAQNSYQVPACVIGGMACNESGYGFTRSGYFANNLFGLKYWNQSDPSGAGSGVSTWQLKGQPDEAWDGSVVVTANYGTDRLVFNETPRYDNRYRAFTSYSGSINYLAGTTLRNSKYMPALNSYISRINSGWTIRDAALQYVYDIAEAGYNHNGGAYYRDVIGAVMDTYNMYTWNTTAGPDITAPSVTITAPANGASVSGNVTISANASDNVGVTKVEFYSNNGGYLIAADNTAPYSITWATAGYVPNGSQTLVAKAYDAANNTKTHSVTVTVSNGGTTLAQAVDNTALTVTTGGTSNWYADNITWYSGASSARSGVISHSQNNYMQFTASGPKTLSFYWKVSSEQYYDYLELWIDGVKKNSISGSTSWAYQSWWLASGSHTIKFVYRKDGATTAGSDCGWVDYVRVQ